MSHDLRFCCSVKLGLCELSDAVEVLSRIRMTSIASFFGLVLWTAPGIFLVISPTGKARRFPDRQRSRKAVAESTSVSSGLEVE